jgi:hypothetical protein
VKLRSQTNGKAHRHDAERAVQWERAALGVLLETPEMWTQIDNLSGEVEKFFKPSRTFTTAIPTPI